MKGYKGFDKNFRCLDLQYEVGNTYKLDGELEICERGFHFCDTPLAVFEYYRPNESRYALVEATGKIIGDEEHKFCTDEITIVKELSIDEFVDAAEYSGEKIKTDSHSVAINTDRRSAAKNMGAFSVAASAAKFSAATVMCNYSIAANTGDNSAAVGTFSWSNAINSGDDSLAVCFGINSFALNSGIDSAAVVNNENSIAVAAGIRNKAKGALGCWLVLTEWEDWELVDVKAFMVDGEKIKADTFYTLKDGVPVEVD